MRFRCGTALPLAVLFTAALFTAGLPDAVPVPAWAAQPAAGPDGSTPAVISTPTRPQLDPATAARYTPEHYLGDWRPSRVRPRPGDALLVVGAGARYPTVRSAVDAAVARGGTSRAYLAVLPGTYREVVCVPAGAPPITLFGLSPDPRRTVIVADHANPTPKAADTPANPCTPRLGATTYGTTASATVSAFAADFQAADLTFANDYVEGSYPGSNQSAVALYALGDRQLYENVRVLGNQDTLLSGTASTATVARHYFHRSYVAGDTDFVFGRGTAVFDRVTIAYVSARRTDGVIFAPSTAPGNPYGFLVIHSRLTADGPLSGTVRLGRAWDESVGSLAGYLNGVSPNGQLVIRDSDEGGHLSASAPWGPSTVGRPYCSADCMYSPNRFAEYRNVGPGSAG